MLLHSVLSLLAWIGALAVSCIEVQPCQSFKHDQLAHERQQLYVLHAMPLAPSSAHTSGTLCAPAPRETCRTAQDLHLPRRRCWPTLPTVDKFSIFRTFGMLRLTVSPIFGKS
ncbi:hypothetical protein H310_09613 [Aphanomyces invadans]|uniref:Secreted protein n=1 Tax=Aphanomyces invadans TaxID=157072 RepID=A0A024TT91_9STRA|nr:hypothetical protein H310_09613 [Aphanomyces invadans]ETV97234.1 hypothetical protein H310_09613 [Aphanomyces invadans]|eukprot:XP_008873942.1 hypothetical protein H310_09613 [Aphanomyces invadans]